jgi:hypothetical protein
MILNVKALGLAFVAVAAMSVAATGAAQAAQLHVTTAQKANITGTNTNQHVFKLTSPENSEIKCNLAQFEGTVQGGSPQITAEDVQLTATYTEDCTAFGLNATIDMNGCKYTITGENQGALTARVDITGCTTITGQQNHKAIEITVPGCTVTVPQQHGLSHITFTNEGSGATEDVLAHVNVQGITYESHGALCPGGNTITTHNGDYTGTATFKAFLDNGNGQATHNGHTYQTHLCGAQVGLFAT